MSEKPEVPIKFDWVGARSKCSLSEVFKALELGARDDVDAINALIISNTQIKFKVVGNGIRFSVICEYGAQTSGSRDFYRKDNEIFVSNENSKVIFTATITLNSLGRCMLKIGEDELEEWQVRRKALEDLFFQKDMGTYL